jgi:hypothetical protein
LRILASGGAHSFSELARAVGVSEDTLRYAIEDLARMGYLRAVEGTCEAACQGCAQSEACLWGERGRIWTVTEKGIDIARKLS